MSVAAGLMSVRAVEDRRDGFSGEQSLPSSVGQEVVFCVVLCPSCMTYMVLCPSNEFFVVLCPSNMISLVLCLSSGVFVVLCPSNVVCLVLHPSNMVFVVVCTSGGISVVRCLSEMIHVVPCPSRVAREPPGSAALCMARVGAGSLREQPPRSLCSSSLGAPPAYRQTSRLRNHPGFSCPSQCWLGRRELPKRTSETSVSLGSFPFSGVHRVSKARCSLPCSCCEQRLELQPGKAEGLGDASPR